MIKKHFFILLAALLFCGATLSALEKEIDYKNTLDNSTQKAAVFVPSKYTPAKATPLLAIAHYMGGNRFTAKKSGYYPECENRGWLLVCPELHGQKAVGKYSLAAPNAQYDILDAIDFMKKNYNVDETRIYIAGRSMGGMLTALMAAKHPDIFAGAVAGQGIYDLKRFMENALPKLEKASLNEIVPFSTESQFDYERRSTVNFAKNLKYVPLVLWHGTNDTWVRPEQALILFKEAKKYNPFQTDINWLECACHCADNYSPAWICQKLCFYQNKAEAGYGLKTKFFPELHFVIDSDQPFFWLNVKTKDKKSFCEVDAVINDNACNIFCKNVAEMTIDLNKIAKLINLKKITIQSPTPVILRVMKDAEIITETSKKAIDLK